MSDEDPILEYASPRTPTERGTGAWWMLSLTATLASAMLAPAFMCGCGYLAPEGLVFTGGMAALACYGWLSTRGPFWRLFAIAFMIFPTYLLLKNIADVLWVGHRPMFRSPF